MKIFATILFVSTVVFIESMVLAADPPLLSRSPLELVLNCGNTFSNKFNNDTFYPEVSFRNVAGAAADFAMQVTFRNLSDKSMERHIYVPNLTIVWDGKEYKQTLRWGAWSEVPFSPQSTDRFYYFLTNFDIPPEARAVGRHTIAVRDAFSETNTFTYVAPVFDTNTYTITKGYSPFIYSQSNRLIFAESSTLTVFIDDRK